MDRNRIDRQAVLEILRNKYPDMPDPGTQEWGGFLRKLKEENPEDYKMALLLGGAVTQALQKEIQRSQRRDALKGFLNRLFMREARKGPVPHKRKIALLIFTVVGALFLIAFFFGTAPKKEASGGGIGAVAAENIVSSGKAADLGQKRGVKGGEAETEEEGVPVVDGDGARGEAGEGPFSLSKAIRESANGASQAPGSGSANSSTPGSSPGGPGTGAGSGVAVPPPPPPVYGYGGTTPPPPDASLAAAGQTGQGGIAPPPLVLYEDTGMPNGPSAGSAVVAQPSAPGSGPPLQGGQTGGGMLFLTAPSSGMLVVQGANPGGLTVQGPISEEPGNTPNPAPPPGAVPYVPVPPPGGGQ